MPDPSTQPIQPIRYEAPSSYAKGDDFHHWCHETNVHRVISPPPDVERYYAKLSEFKLPKSMQEEVPACQVKAHDILLRQLTDWAYFNPTSLGDGDVHDICAVWPVLCVALNNIKINMKDRHHEASQRHGVDLLIALAFQDRLKCQSRVLRETAIRLWAPHPSTNLAVLPKPVAITDTLVTTEELFPSNIFDIKGDKATLKQMYWGESNRLSLILFAAECKRDRSEYDGNQLIMSLSTAQHQRRALGLPKRILLGATYAMGWSRMYSSWWDEKDNKIFICEHPVLDLSVPLEFMQCYSILCNLHDEVKGAADDLTKANATTVAEALRKYAWRAPDLPTSQTPSQSTRLTKDDDCLHAGQNVEGVDDLDPQEKMEWEGSYAKWQELRDEACAQAPPPVEPQPLTRQSLQMLDPPDLGRQFEQWGNSLSPPLDSIPFTAPPAYPFTLPGAESSASSSPS